MSARHYFSQDEARERIFRRILAHLAPERVPNLPIAERMKGVNRPPSGL